MRTCRISLLLIILSPLGAPAHQGLHESIAAIGEQIAREPGRCELYVQRAELHRAHADWDAALADYERAAALHADPRLDLLRGRMLTDAGWLASAQVLLARYVQRTPDDPGGHEALARLHAHRGEHLVAAEAYDRAVRLMREPSVDLYLARAAERAALGNAGLATAIAGLDEGMRRIGQPVASLQLLAIDLELRRRHHDAALRRLATLAGQSARQEQWLVRRGDILRQAGRRAEALDAYRAALAAIAGLSPARRTAPAVLELQRQAQAAIVALEGAATRPSPTPQAAAARPASQPAPQEGPAHAFAPVPSS